MACRRRETSDSRVSAFVQASWFSRFQFLFLDHDKEHDQMRFSVSDGGSFARLGQLLLSGKTSCTSQLSPELDILLVSNQRSSFSLHRSPPSISFDHRLPTLNLEFSLSSSSRSMESRSIAILVKYLTHRNSQTANLTSPCSSTILVSTLIT